MSEQEFLWGLLATFTGLMTLLLLIVLHEKANARPIEWDDEINGDWPHIGDCHE